MFLDKKLKDIKLSTALKLKCKVCKSEFEWTLEPDPDSPAWTAVCECHGTAFLEVKKVDAEFVEDCYCEECEK